MAWTDERIDTLKTMWEAGQTASQIAEALGGVSRNAVIGKAHRLGLQSRPSPVKPNEPGDRTGLVNKLFFLSDVAGQYRRRFKAWNRTVYKITKAGLTLGVVALLLLPVLPTIQSVVSSHFGAHAGN